MLGNGRCKAMSIDGSKRLCHIQRKMHKKVWIAAGNIILFGLRDCQDDKADEARFLKAYNELPDYIRLNEGIASRMDDEVSHSGPVIVLFKLKIILKELRMEFMRRGIATKRR